MTSVESKSNQDVVSFIDEIKAYYLKWLADYEPAFPLCCFSASEILCAYLQEKFNIGTVILSEKKKSKRAFNVHAQIKAGNEVIDFTYFQYRMHNFKLKGLKNWGLNEQELSKFCFGLFDGPFLKSELAEQFNIRHEAKELRFKKEAKASSDFKDYLNLVLNTQEFENYSISDLFEGEPVHYSLILDQRLKEQFVG